jgi:TatA/E family protein of Tat protein translocase
MFGTLGGPELILILVVALIVFGPRRLPEIGKSMGRMLAEFRKASNDFKRTIEDEIEADKARSQAPAAVPPAASSLEAPATPAEPASATAAPEPHVEPPAETTVSRETPPPPIEPK